MTESMCTTANARANHPSLAKHPNLQHGGTDGRTLPARSTVDLQSLIGRKFGGRVVDGIAPKKKDKIRLFMLCKCGDRRAVEMNMLTQGKCQLCVRCRNEALNGSAHPHWAGYGAISGHAWGRWLAGAKQRGLEWSVSIEYVDALWHRQDGRCALTGNPLRIATDRRRSESASLDRIDSSKGYVEANLQFTTGHINIAKQQLSQAEFIAMCRAVVAHVEAFPTTPLLDVAA